MSEATGLPGNSENIRVLPVGVTDWNPRLTAAVLEHQEFHLELLDVVSDPRAVAAAFVQDRPSVVLISSEISGNPRKGYRVAREVRALEVGTRIVMLLESSERDPVIEAFRAGASGVFSLRESAAALAKCIHCVSQGQIWVNTTELGYVLEALTSAMPLGGLDHPNGAVLRPRHYEVVRCVAQGLSNREIAQRLGLSEHTVKNYLFQIFDKLRVYNRVAVAMYGLRLSGLITDDKSRNTAG